MISEEDIVGELLRKKGAYLFHREGQELEFKEQFSLSGLAEYFRDFAAFANNRGGYLIFGVTDSPRSPVGINQNSLEQFNKVDPEKISGYILNIFSSNISWDQFVVEIDKMSFGVFKIYEAPTKPIIAKKDEGKGPIIRNGDVYFRYGGRTQKIQHAELESIIVKRIEKNNRQWLDLMAKIGRTGPQNAAILDTERSLIEKGAAKVLIIDEELSKKLKFIKEGDFTQKEGAVTLKLVGDVVPVDKIEVIRKVRETLTKAYPLSAMEVAAEVMKRIPHVNIRHVWEVISDNNLKNNPDYSAYNFRNKKQEDDFRAHGKLPSVTPSIYNANAVEFIVRVLSGS